MAAYPPPPPPKYRHRTRNLVIVVVVAVVVALACLFTIPVPHPFGTQVTTFEAGAGGYYCCNAYINPPHGSSVSGTWSTTSGGVVELYIHDSIGQMIYTGGGSSGLFSFTASNPPYQLAAVEPVQVSGTITYPIL